MIVIAGFLLGAVTGAAIARKRGGKPADLAQYGAVYGIVFALIALVLTIIIGRLV
ncbi:hypothetical protein [Pseudorhodobacter sp.]|uniref:hypothetical protein n=1 Tax=Pseudorhodobacter sp. TaxID=1934400 RepID=UPI0026499A16|nr:hypothetical protein [Pseudorhodobacter sp.]MDN5788457.1 hypothetical protein [Pseudorhodobacter sp.]